MAWTTPHSLSTEDIWTSADWNTYVRDNLNATITGTVTTALQYCVSTGAHVLATRTADSATVATSEGTTSTSYVDLITAGPSVTVTTGTTCLVMWSVSASNSTNSAEVWASVSVSGATTVAASDTWALMLDGVTSANTNRCGMMRLFTGLTAGSNTFKIQYRAGSGTATFNNRHIIAVPL